MLMFIPVHAVPKAGIPGCAPQAGVLSEASRRWFFLPRAFQPSSVDVHYVDLLDILSLSRTSVLARIRTRGAQPFAACAPRGRRAAACGEAAALTLALHSLVPLF